MDIPPCKTLFCRAAVLLLVILVLSPWLGSAADRDFDLAKWQQTFGDAIDLKAWSRYNPKPWRNYFSASSTDCAKQWYISLGPLGLETLMHDRSWGCFAGNRAIFPRVLCDGEELLLNNFEILHVKPGGPSEGQLQEGDLLIAIDGKILQAAQNRYVGTQLDRRRVRGLEIHAGQLIDAAEGRGSVKLTVLRVNPAQKTALATALDGRRKWQSVSLQPEAETVSAALPAGCELLRLKPPRRMSIEAVWLTNAAGLTHALESSAKSDQLKDVALEVPPGTWQLHARIKSRFPKRDLILETATLVKLPAEFRQYLKTFEIALERIGSFGQSFDPASGKVNHYAAMLAHRLAVQQGDAGAWQAKSYATPSFYTAICGLALMSTQDPAYDESIRKAAHYVAFTGQADKWAYPLGLHILFLAEYYLRTQDAEILAALRHKIAVARRAVLSDYTVGHSIGKPGYGGSGYIGAGGMIAMGLAAASYTPAMSEADMQVLDRMLARAQQIGAHGRIPYGRSGKSVDPQPLRGQGGSCGTGPYFLASLIRGGARHFTDTARRRYSTAPYGSAEDGHATQTLHFCWAMLASANCSDTAYRDSMNAYLWKFTTLREYDGFINQNNYRTEYHNGDGVIGSPYFRSAGYLLIMNAWKRNLATTGKPEYRNHKLRDTDLTFSRDVAPYNYLKRNWSLVAATLGAEAPDSFVTAHTQLRALTPDRQFGKNWKALQEGVVKTAVRELLRAPAFDATVANGQLAELMLGLGFYASCTPTVGMDEEDDVGASGMLKKDAGAAAKKLSSAKEKELSKLLESGQTAVLPHAIVIQPTSIHERIAELGDVAPLRMDNLTLRISDPSGEFLPSAKRVDLGSYHAKVPAKKATAQQLAFSVELSTDMKARLPVEISYEVLGEPVRYTAHMDWPAPTARAYAPQLTRITVQGQLGLDFADQYALAVELENGDVVGCEHRSDLPAFIPSGTPVEFEISPDSIWGHDVRSARVIDGGFRKVAYRALTGISPTQAEGLQGLGLDDYPIPTKGGTFELELQDRSDIQALLPEFVSAKKISQTYSVHLRIGGEWQLARDSVASRSTLLYLSASDVTAIRLEFAAGKSKNQVRLHRLTLIQPPPDTAAKEHW